jgi:hypothetical protein
MYLGILDAGGQVGSDKNLLAMADTFLSAFAPFRNGLVVTVECLFRWYWLADLCTKKIAFVLGNALYMMAIYGGKAKNDKIDAGKIARLLRGGNLPQAYVYPAGMKETRDLLRRWQYLVRKRPEALGQCRTPTASTTTGPSASSLAPPQTVPNWPSPTASPTRASTRPSASIWC